MWAAPVPTQMYSWRPRSMIWKCTVLSRTSSLKQCCTALLAPAAAVGGGCVLKTSVVCADACSDKLPFMAPFCCVHASCPTGMLPDVLSTLPVSSISLDFDVFTAAADQIQRLLTKCFSCSAFTGSFSVLARSYITYLIRHIDF